MAQRKSVAPKIKSKTWDKKTEGIKNRKSLLWAFDPFAENDFGLEAGAKAARQMGALLDREVEPVYVLSSEGFQWPGEDAQKKLKTVIPKVEEIAEKKAKRYLGSESNKPYVILSQGGGLRKGLTYVFNLAKKRQTAPLVITTHGRHGLGRWVLGSFAETALLQARTPVLVVPSDYQERTIRKVLIPTNFSPASRKWLFKQLDWLAKNRIEVVIYHKLVQPIDPYVQSGISMAGGGWISIPTLVEEEKARREKDANKLKEDLEKKGIEVTALIDFQPGSVESGVLAAADKQKTDLIIMMTEANQASAVFLGSLARQLVRSSKLPLYVQHS